MEDRKRIFTVFHIRLRSAPLGSSRCLHAQLVRPHVLRGGAGICGDKRLQHMRQGAVCDDRVPLLLQVGRQLCAELPALRVGVGVLLS
jgi:hypothetical protein